MKYKPSAGESISRACNQMVELVREHDTTVTAEFNGVEICAKPGMTAGDLEQAWHTESERRRREYAASPAGQEAKRRQEEFASRAAKSAALGIVSFDVTNPESWQKWRQSNEDGGYGECILRYAARWANAMDVLIADGHRLEDVADKTSHEADTEGITGFMYGAAVSMLSEVWRHGESLRRWHNAKTQLKDEGDKANESGGVLNPAILRIE